MPSTMILTTCISMVLKRNRGLSLDIGSRYERENTKLITLTTNLKSWIQSLPQTDAEAAQVIVNCDAILRHYYSLSLLLLL